MSNTNDINFKGTDGDARGHVYKSGRIDDGSATDAEGHGRKFPFEDVDDAEGHGTPGKPRVKMLDDGSDADAEGSGIRKGGLDAGSDDAEGHRVRGG